MGAVIACYLNLILGLTITQLIIIAILLIRGPRILLNLLAARRRNIDELSDDDAKKIVEAPTDIELVSE